MSGQVAAAETSPTTADTTAGTEEAPEFRVSLAGFAGPFDLLLSLISKHELDITEVSLSLVTDEFISYLEQLQGSGQLQLDRASEFIVVAATLLDMKIISLLPQGEAVDAEEIAILEARDLLFARLLQYRAFQQASHWFRERLLTEEQRHVRAVALEPKFRMQQPQLKWSISPQDFAAVAALVFAPKEIPVVGLDHLHAPLVSIREQAAHIVERLQAAGSLSFRELIAGLSVESERGVIVARFLAVLELYRRALVMFSQAAPLGELFVEWSGSDWSAEELATLGSDYD